MLFAMVKACLHFENILLFRTLMGLIFHVIKQTDKCTDLYEEIVQY